MSFWIGFLTVMLVLDCVLLILLVMIQLPKKDAGAGLAFGGSATDALFGAGTGNALTKITKYATGVFFALAILVAALQSQYYHRPGSEFRRALEQQQNKAPLGSLPPSAATPEAPAPIPAAAPPATTTAPIPLTTTSTSAPAAKP